MEAFNKITSAVAALDRVNVDTDQIIPAQYLKLITKTGFGPYLFDSWRYGPDRAPRPDFELNRPGYENARILVSGRNFGSGSSREHAVWALVNYGFRVVIAPKFADIFHKNCFENGLVPVIVSDDVLEQIMIRAKEQPGWALTVDLEAERLDDGAGFTAPFVVHEDPETHAFRRYTLLNGLDEIGLTLRHEADIARFEAARSR